MADFFARMSYSFGNEDPHTELQALKLKKSDRVLCITASGDRPLHLLLDDCMEVVSLDANPIQNHLLNLKMTAMQELDFPQYLSFLGILPDKHRSRSFKKLMSSLQPAAGQYWLKHQRKIVKGVLYQGTIEQWVSRIAKVLHLLRGRTIRQLFEFDNIEEQRKFVQKRWDRPAWRKLFDVVLNPRFSRLFLTDPGLHAHIDTSIHPGAYLYNRIYNSLTRHLARESILMSLLLQGKVGKEALPPYLTEKGFKVIKSRINRITSYTGDLIQYLENAPENSFDAFSLSDVASYINAETFKRLMHAVQRTARPNARFCIREFMSRHQIPIDLKSVFQRDTELEKTLEHQDRCFVYHFMTGTVNKE